MLTFLIILATGVGVAAAVAGVAMMLRGGGDEAVEDRLSSLAKNLSSKEKSLLDQEQNLLNGMDDVPGMAEQALLKFFNVRLMIEQADVDIPLNKFLTYCGGLAVVGAILPIVLRMGFIFAPIGALLGLLPIMWLKWKKKARLKKFASQLPEALELMARGLRAGHSLQAGFQLVGEETNDPLGGEFLRVFEEQNLGISLDDALDGMTERVPNLDLQFFATAVVLQRQTGGDLAEILDKIGALIRARFKIFGQIQALTGEGRLSGVVLMALPPVLFLVMMKINYDYTMVLFTDELGKKMLAVAVFLQIVGAFVIKKIVNIKV